ncbi:hypothetical protein [Mycobacterium sp.]|nr:hypothetical protein [Mycobacterium sp.]
MSSRASSTATFANAYAGDERRDDRRYVLPVEVRDLIKGKSTARENGKH